MAVFSKVLGSAISLAYVVSALNNGLAVTPQMGWNDWNAFQCNLDEQLILATADVIKNTGLRDLGYHYVILDDCWSSGRSSSGQLVADAKKFPNGMKYVGDQLHASGFGFGMYSSAGTKTCAGYPASLGRETTDANTFASWGVDYLKYDNCNNQGESGSQAVSSARYDAMEKALAATGRKILYSLCNWGEDSPWIWGPSVGNSWRITGDITDRFNTQSSTCPVPNSGGYGCSVTQILSKQAQIASYSGPGGWNDLDMLEVGNGGMTDDEYVAHFSMWSAAKSPLIMGNDMRKLKASDWSILANPAVIAVNQDPLGKAALYRWTHNNVQLWSGPLASTTGSSVDDMVVVLYNNGGSSTTASASLADIFGSSNVPNGKFEIRDLWGSRLSSSQAQAVLNDGAAAHSSWLYNASQQSYKTGLEKADSKLLGTAVGTVSGATGSISQSVPALGCRMFRLRAVGDSTTTTAKTTATTTQAGTTTTAGGQGPQQTQYGQCGGQGWTGPTACVPPATCHSQNQWYSQCL